MRTRNVQAADQLAQARIALGGSTADSTPLVQEGREHAAETSEFKDVLDPFEEEQDSLDDIIPGSGKPIRPIAQITLQGDGPSMSDIVLQDRDEAWDWMKPACTPNPGVPS